MPRPAGDPGRAAMLPKLQDPKKTRAQLKEALTIGRKFSTIGHTDNNDMLSDSR
jgi:hypothetical protein